MILTPLRDRIGWGIIESHISQSRVAIMGWDWPYIVSKQAMTTGLEYSIETCVSCQSLELITQWIVLDVVYIYFNIS